MESSINGELKSLRIKTSVSLESVAVSHELKSLKQEMTKRLVDVYSKERQGWQ